MRARATAWRFVCGGIFGRGETTADDVAKMLDSAVLDWREIVLVAGTHLVSPALWLGLRTQRLTESLPHDARQYLEALYAMNVARNVAIADQLDEAIDTLNGHGIAPMLLKGAAYRMLGIHADPGERITSDLDLLIPGAQIEAARDALHALGYSPKTRTDRPGHHHLAPLVRDGSPAAIELHRDVLAPWARQMLPTRAVWDAQVFPHGEVFSVPCATHATLHRFVHDAIVDRHACQFVIPLRSVQDIVALDRHYGPAINWEWISRRARQFGYDDELSNYVYAASCIAGIRVPACIRIGPRHALNYSVCKASEHWRAFGRVIGIIERFSAFRIERQYPGDGSLAAGRLRLFGSMIRSGWRSVR